MIEVRNHNDLTWFDQAGGYHSDALHVVERLRFVDADTISYEATLQDPKAYTKPWKIAFPIVRHKETGFELLEDACFEVSRVTPPCMLRAAILPRKQRRSPSDSRDPHPYERPLNVGDSSIIDVYSFRPHS